MAGWSRGGSRDPLYDAAFRHLAIRVDPEVAHRASMVGLSALARIPGAPRAGQATLSPTPESLQVRVLGRTWRTPLGLAAGFDKNAAAISGFGALGFGGVEIGTVTGQPQPGNPTPRLFRLPADRAIINRMGFNNDGSAAIAERVQAWRAAHPEHARPVLGINIGRTKAVAAQDAVADYVLSATRLGALADYVVVNVSSPNTPGLRDLQAVSELRPLLAAVQQAIPAGVPLLVKVAPDLADQDVIDVADLALELGLAGIVATNTTISRDGLRTPGAEVEACGAGGLSGPILRNRSMQVLRLLRGRAGDRLTLVSAGGITDLDDVWARLAAGASVVQAYTALVYGGPRWPAAINAGLADRLQRQGFSSVEELIGSGVGGS